MKLKEIIYSIFSGLFTLVFANLGVKILKDFPERPYLGWLTIIMAFLAFIFFAYTFQIRNNQDKIKELETEITHIKKQKEDDEKLLNTLRDIVILNKSYKTKNG